LATAVFKSYDDGYFVFTFENGIDMIFEDVNPKVLYQFDLKNDPSYIDQEFKLVFTEYVEKSDEESVIYRIESLKLI